MASGLPWRALVGSLGWAVGVGGSFALTALVLAGFPMPELTSRAQAAEAQRISTPWVSPVPSPSVAREGAAIAPSAEAFRVVIGEAVLHIYTQEGSRDPRLGE